MAVYQSPGVYVEELDSGFMPMEGAGTSTAGFIGAALKGPVSGLPVQITDFDGFRRVYGGYLPEQEYGDYRYLAYAVEHFFINGGSRAYIMRVAPRDAVCAAAAVPAMAPVLELEARNPGIWGNSLEVIISPSYKAKTQIYEVLESAAGKAYVVKDSAGFAPGDVAAFSDGVQTVYNKVVKSQGNVMVFEQEFTVDVVDKSLHPDKVITSCELNLEIRFEDLVESYEHVSFNIDAASYIEKKLAKSELVSATYCGREGGEIRSPFSCLAGPEAPVVAVQFDGGGNGSPLEMTAPDFIGVNRRAGSKTGLQAFADNDAVSLIAVPGVTDPAVQLALTAHCENLASCFAVLDLPRHVKTAQDIVAHRNLFDTTYAALYHPWLMVYDPLKRCHIAVPPSGSILGLYARNDRARGVHTAPADEAVRACVGLYAGADVAEPDHPAAAGVNLLRALPGAGIRVRDAVTAGGGGSWKYVNVRRFIIFIEETVKANTNWAVFEPNDEVLWVRVQRTIEVFLGSLWRSGSLAGSSPGEAFFVDIGRSTMSPEDIDSGRMICVIGVAPVKPAEFIIFRITQHTSRLFTDESSHCRSSLLKS